jgi:2Fe-2S ferredoxin
MDTVKIIFKIGGRDWIVNASVGDTLLDVTKKNKLRLLGACGGVGLCGACHVFIDNEFLPKLNEKTENEENFLDIFPIAQSNSRLACQVIVSKDLDGMTVIVP